MDGSVFFPFRCPMTFHGYAHSILRVGLLLSRWMDAEGLLFQGRKTCDKGAGDDADVPAGAIGPFIPVRDKLSSAPAKSPLDQRISILPSGGLLRLGTAHGAAGMCV